jgi:hypothetical protein
MSRLGELTWPRAVGILVAGGLLLWMWIGEIPAAVMVVFVFGIGVTGLWLAATMTPANQDERSGVGFVGAILRALPYPVTRVVMALLGLGICVLAVAGAVEML